MKRKSRLILAAACLLAAAAVGLLTFAQQQPSTQRIANSTTGYRLSGPYTHKNLTIFLIHGKDLASGENFLTLQEALARKKVIVYETKDVNELAIRNLSNRDIYVQAGDIVRGGEQDRMISMDFIVPPKSGRIPIGAFCVEQGRWSRRGNEVAGSFSSSENSATSRELKLAAKKVNSQGLVWDYVKVAQEKLSKNVGGTVNSDVSVSSLELAVEDSRVKESSGSYINALSNILQRERSVIGYVFAINGKVNSADIYSSSTLFAKLWPKLLKASAIEALAELNSDARQDAVSADAVNAFLVEAEQGKPSEKNVTSRVNLLLREDANNVFFETRDRGRKSAWIHRNYIKK